VVRGVVVVERDGFDQAQATHKVILIAMARCRACGHRCRVLPGDVLPHKTYSLPVIELHVAAYLRGDRSLRQVAWQLLPEATPQHTTLHAWSEGLGAYALGRTPGEIAGAEPCSALRAEVRRRWPEVAPTAIPAIDPRRYRSPGRRERLVAAAALLHAAGLVPGADPTLPLSSLRHRAFGFGLSSPVSFRTGLSCTPIGHVVGRGRDARRFSSRKGARPCPKSDPSRTRSPPGASS